MKYLLSLLIFVGLTRAAHASESLPSKFVHERVELTGCSIDSEVIVQSLEDGLSRVSVVNPLLAGHIRESAFKKNLKVYCDVGPPPAAVKYWPQDDSIHLRITSAANLMTKANFFHEFLHFYGLDHVEDSRIVGDFDDFLYDPVYACHLTGFPELADILKIDAAIAKGAAEKCASVSPVSQDLRGAKY